MKCDFENGRWFEFSLRVIEEHHVAIVGFLHVNVQSGDRVNKIPNILLVEPYNMSSKDFSDYGVT